MDLAIFVVAVFLAVFIFFWWAMPRRPGWHEISRHHCGHMQDTEYANLLGTPCEKCGAPYGWRTVIVRDLWFGRVEEREQNAHRN